MARHPSRSRSSNWNADGQALDLRWSSEQENGFPMEDPGGFSMVFPKCFPIFSMVSHVFLEVVPWFSPLHSWLAEENLKVGYESATCVVSGKLLEPHEKLKLERLRQEEAELKVPWLLTLRLLGSAVFFPWGLSGFPQVLVEKLSKSLDQLYHGDILRGYGKPYENIWTQQNPSTLREYKLMLGEYDAGYSEDIMRSSSRDCFFSFFRGKSCCYKQRFVVRCASFFQHTTGRSFNFLQKLMKNSWKPHETSPLTFSEALAL